MQINQKVLLENYTVTYDDGIITMNPNAPDNGGAQSIDLRQGPIVLSVTSGAYLKRRDISTIPTSGVKTIIQINDALNISFGRAAMPGGNESYSIIIGTSDIRGGLALNAYNLQDRQVRLSIENDELTVET